VQVTAVTKQVDSDLYL